MAVITTPRLWVLRNRFPLLYTHSLYSHLWRQTHPQTDFLACKANKSDTKSLTRPQKVDTEHTCRHREGRCVHCTRLYVKILILCAFDLTGLDVRSTQAVTRDELGSDEYKRTVLPSSTQSVTRTFGWRLANPQGPTWPPNSTSHICSNGSHPRPLLP